MLGFMVLATFTFAMLDKVFNLGLISEEAADVFTTLFILICTVVFFIPGLRKSFSKWFLLDRKKIVQSICFPILAAILMDFLENLYRLIPYWLGSDIIGVGSNQITTIKGVSDLGLELGTSILVPFNEEFIFRYLMFVGVPLLIVYTLNDFDWFNRIKRLIEKRKKMYLISWIIIVNLLFGMAHGPDLLSFPIYFSSGILFTFFFLRYGFLSAWLSHGMSNLFSGVALQIILNLFV